ncbi:hypothetical protein [Paenibacillus mucilaginosus]|uniref:Uncharacterized protein n=3 Tax=Paenibacillus mucilaginosus TaxID=61624 RepID=H6N9D3_9BACL|nr:hypothetical protein [Paenibacillus mucilaginosus]AEI42132.1 hypothetical protein KNP414_03588 [Paenibacillus mucilaginosus KNP414]AFC27939.1 hypothetical protein PM3016_1000 [Paenibacillus mucilaginosus 3016]AFH60094.1 hypothetical protein B2K_05045 [Paenibacillus mucilaginosus K02]MCG7214113.1 hypothetical protein [Paenibacillus mucilaginosus]WDM28634.1 hypothetical protein KCX80_05270 [Paenibacillus mucilaginosus]
MSCPKCPTQRVFDPPRKVYRDFYHPQIVEVIHNVEIVNRHHCVPVPCHIVTYTVRDEFCPSPLTGAAEAQVLSKKKKAKRK